MTLRSKESIFKLWGGNRGPSSSYVLEQSVFVNKISASYGLATWPPLFGPCCENRTSLKFYIKLLQEKATFFTFCAAYGPQQLEDQVA